MTITWLNWGPIQNSTKTVKGAPITAVPHDPTHLDLFMVDTNGACRTISWDKGSWASKWATVGKSTKAKSGAAITAIARDANYLDLFMIDNNGVVQTISRDNGVWASSWTSIKYGLTTSTSGRITAVYRPPTLTSGVTLSASTDLEPTHLDLFVAGNKGVCWTISRDNGVWATSWTSVYSAIKTTSGGPITAIYRDASHVDLFMADSSGNCLTIGRDGDGTWESNVQTAVSGGGSTSVVSNWDAVPGNKKTSSGGHIAAVYRDPTHLDLFMVGTDGTIWTTSCENRIWAGTWTAVGVWKAPSPAWVNAIYRDPTHLDLFVGGKSGSCFTISWDNGSWAADWSSIQNSVKTSVGGPITAVYRDPEHLDLFMADTDGVCRTTHPQATAIPVTASGIEHVFVLMLENRSFDHMLGWSNITGTDAVARTATTINGLNGSNYSNFYNGVRYTSTNDAPDVMNIDPGHEFPDTVEQLAGAGARYPSGGPYPPINNSGFVANYVSQANYASKGHGVPNQTMKGFNPRTLPILNALAQEFVVCDQWFSAMPGPTWPNRFFVHAASSGGLDHSPSSAEIVNSQSFDGYAFRNGTIYDRLDDAGLEWRIYAGDSFPQALGMDGMQSWTFEDYEDFAEDIQDATYPAVYTFIEPDYGATIDPTSETFTGGNSQHPIDKASSGEALIKQTYEALRASPLWDTSVLIITYDEHGGFYDHVSPPAAPAPDDGAPTESDNNSLGFTFTQYGVRVPAVIISPRIPKNLIDHRLYDHTSILATLEHLFSLHPLTNRDKLANPFTDLFSLSTPRTDAPVTLPAVYVPPTTSPAATPLPTTPTAAAADEPMHGNDAGFVHIALRRDLEITPPEQHGARIARFRQVRTRREAHQYLEEVKRRLRGHHLDE